MNWLKRVGWLLCTLLALLLAALGVYVARSFPTLDGELRLSGLLATVTVRRDAADVTHIQGSSAQDVWFGLGYVHAQERLWQLELNRRVMHGELSEVFGEATVDTDKLMRTLGIMQAAQAQWQGLSETGKNALRAYADGVNAYVASPNQALSPEFQLLGVSPGRWSPIDSLGWSLMMALDLGGNWGNEFARLSLAKDLSTGRIWQLFAPYPGEQPASSADFAALYHRLELYRTDPKTASFLIAPGGDSISSAARFASEIVINTPTATLTRQVADWSQDFSQNLGNVEGKGSNNWVVAGDRTASGKPLLANDPHLGLSAPAIWYFAHLQAPDMQAIGATLPGLPFVVLGRTRGVAWGFTNTGPDVQDLYIERIHPQNPNQYRGVDVNGQVQWLDFAQRSETVKVKGKPNVTFTARSTRHGPVLSDVQKSHIELIDTQKYVLALRWSALDPDNRTVEAGLMGNRANSVAELMAAYADYHSPMQNVVMADVNGAVAFKAVGRVPLRSADNDIRGVAPSPGWEARYDWTGWLPYANTPYKVAGKKAWIASANERITPPGYPFFMGQEWAVPYRFDRIEQLLDGRAQHDMASMQAMQGDTVSLAARRLLPFVKSAKSTHPLAAPVLTLLGQFDGDMRADSASALVFAVWADELTRGLLTPKLGEARMKLLYGKRHFRSALEIILEKSDGWWCAPMTCADQSSAAFTRALDRLTALAGSDPAQWQWGRLHLARSAHQPFDNVALLAPWFDVSVPVGGDPFTVNVGQYWPNDPKTPFAARHAASMRAVYDLADLENSVFIYQTGQSGLVFSSRYRDMSAAWAQLQYRPLQMNPAVVVHSQTLQP